jgi:hypothetical protein
MAVGPVIHVPVTPGMREDLSPHLAPVGTIKNAVNVRFPIAGEVESRRGTLALSVTTSADVALSSLSTAEFAQGIPGGFVVGAEGLSYIYDFGKDRLHAAGSYSNAVPHGVFTTMAAEEAVLTLGDSTPWPLSVAVGGGYVAVMWSGGSGAQDVDSTGRLRCQIFTEGGTLVSTIVLGNYTTGWVLYDAVTAGFIIIAQEGASGDTTQLAAAIVTLAASGATLGSFVDIANLTTSADYWAAAPWPGQGWVLVYQVGGTAAQILKVAGTTTGSSVNFTTNGTDGPLSVYADATHVYAGFVDITADCVAKARVYNTSLTLTSGVGAVTIYTDTGTAFLSLTPPLFGTSNATTSAFYVVGRSLDLGRDTPLGTFTKAGTLAQDGTHTTVSTLTYNMFPMSAPFNTGMVWCRYKTPAATDAFGNIYVRNLLLDYQNDRIATADTYWKHRWPRVALAGEAFADPAPSNYQGGAAWMHLCHPVQMTSGHWLAGLPRLVRAESPDGATGWGLAVAEWLEFATEARRPARTFGREVMVAGTVTLHGKGSFGTNNYTTPSLSEPTTTNQAVGMDCGFFVEPSIIAPTQSNSATGELTPLGVYQYRSVIEWIDSSGRRWRSRPSRALTVTMTGANDTNTFTDADDFAWLRQGYANVASASNIVKHYYRTTAGGSTFYRVSPPQGASIAGAGATFVDTLNDGKADEREVLYTDGGVLANDHPASCRFLAVTADRVWLGGLWDETQIQSSKVLIPGEPPQFTDSPAFRVVLPERCTALASQDGVLIAFTESAIYAVQGAGPNDQGQGAWESPSTITRSTGAIAGSFTLETSQGIFFQSLRGIEMLPRGGGEPVFIGAAVQDTLGSATVTSAAVIKSGTSSTARFTLSTTTVLVYDLETGAWSKDLYPFAMAAVCDTEEGAALVGVANALLAESQTAATDSENSGPAAIASTLEWVALRPFGIAGSGRFTAAIGLFDELTSGSSPGYQAGNATIYLSVDRFTDSGKSWDMSAFNSPDYRKHVPLEDVGTSAALKLTTAVSGWRFMGFTVEVQQQEGGRRMAETEQG